MTLRAKIILYLSLLHLLVGAIAVLVLLTNRSYLFAVEALFVLSVMLGLVLVRAFFVPLDLIRTGAELIAERDFTSRFRHVGQPEMDQLIDVYNRMIDQLREERLRVEENRQFLEKLVAVSPAGVIVLDFDGRISTANPAAERLIGEKNLTGIDPATSSIPQLVAISALATGVSRMVTLPGNERVKLWRGEFLDRGFPRSFFLMEEVSEELRASERAAYEKLIRMMSHEVNNTAAAVISLLESSRAYASQVSEADRDDYERAISISTARMQNLNVFMNAFADVVRLPAPSPSEVDLSQLVADLATLVRPELESRDIDLAINAPANPHTVSIDKNQFEQVLLNLLRNGMEAIGRGGRLGLSVQQDGKTTRLSVTDDGPGIDPAVQDQLFVPFFSTKRNGRGLGLTLVRDILVQHGARFGLENRQPRGAEFWIELRSGIE